MSLMLSAPATIPATSAPTFTSALDPALPATVMYSSTRSDSPADSASNITGTSPAVAIRLSSSNSAENLWETRTTGAPVSSGWVLSTSPILAGHRGIRLLRPTSHADSAGGSRLNPVPDLGCDQ